MKKPIEQEKEETPKQLYSDAELRELDGRIEKSFGGFSTTQELKRFYAVEDGARISGGTFYINPFTYEKVTDKLEQWRRWRHRTYPQERVDAYEKMAEQVEESKTIVHHGTEGLSVNKCTRIRDKHTITESDNLEVAGCRKSCRL